MQETKRAWSRFSTPDDLAATAVNNVNANYRARLSTLERMAIYIAAHVGTPGFFLLIGLWTISWVLWNIYAPSAYRVDSGMEFAVWIFISNAIQILLMPLLLIAQNLQSRHDTLRAENDYQVTVESKQEIEVVLAHLYLLSENMKAVMDHLQISEEAVRAKDRIPDIVEERFAERQQQLLNEMSLQLAKTHTEALERAKKLNGLK